MNEKIEVLGFSVEKCYVNDMLESINEKWNKDTLSTYGVITMNLLMAAQKDVELGNYIRGLEKVVVDEPEVLKAAGILDPRMEEEISGHGFSGSLFWFLSQNRNHVFLLGELEADERILYDYIKENHPEIVIVGSDSLQEVTEDRIDRVINEINSFEPHAVLGCSSSLGVEKFVVRNRKKINTPVFLCLGGSREFTQETGIKKSWIGSLLEKSSFKKLVSQYNEGNAGTGKGEE